MRKQHTPRPLAVAIRRANCEFAYWAYRRSIGNPYPLRTALRGWIERFRFEHREARARAASTGGPK